MVVGDAMPLPPPPGGPQEQTPSNGWDLLDDYQVGKEVRDDQELQTRRIANVSKTPLPDAVELPPAPVPQSDTTSRLARLWRTDATAADDAATIAKIMGRMQAQDAEATAAIERATAAKARDDLELLRQRQQREVAEYIALQRSRERTQRQFANNLQQMLQDVADIFLALGICPDHLEWLPEQNAFCSWGGRLYDHAELFSLRDQRGQPLYVTGPGPDGPGTVCYSPRERKWKLDQPVASSSHLTPVDRLLPVPRRHAGGTLRFSATRARTILMHEGVVPIYVVLNRVYTVSHLRAAHHLHGSTSFLDKVAAPVAAASDSAAKAARSLSEAADTGRTTAIEKVTDAVGVATDGVTRLLQSTTRLFRRDRKP